MPATDSFTSVITRLRTDDPAAAEEVFRRFAGRLAALTVPRLAQLLGRKEDPEDVLQSAFRSFFTRFRHGDFELAGWESLWGVLTVITLRKCGNRVAHYRAARRDVGREVEPAGESAGPEWEALAREPTPAEAAALAETVDGLTAGLDERERRVLGLHLAGLAVPEIARAVGRAERTVRRTLEQIQVRLERRLLDGPTP